MAMSSAYCRVPEFDARSSENLFGFTRASRNHAVRNVRAHARVLPHEQLAQTGGAQLLGEAGNPFRIVAQHALGE